MSAINSKDIEQLISYIPLCQETAEALKVKSGKIYVKKGDILFNERDIVDRVYFVLVGKITMYKLGEVGHKKIVYILNSGEFINEVIFDGLTASISCEAFEDSEILYLLKNDLLKIMAEDFEFSKIIINSMGKKIRRLYRQLKNTIPMKIDKKLAAKLWKLSKDYGVETKEGTLINIEITITYLASMLGSARETISKCINKFERDGLISFQGKKLLIPDRKALSMYFRGIEE